MEHNEPENGEESIDEQGRNPTQQRIDREQQEEAAEGDDASESA